MVSNIGEIINSYNNFRTAFIVGVIICIVLFILSATAAVLIGELSDIFPYLCLIAIVVAMLIFFYNAFSTNKNQFCKIDKKITDIVKENISIYEKKKEVINYLETEKFVGNIPGYKNFNYNFKITDGIVNYNFTIVQ